MGRLDPDDPSGKNTIGEQAHHEAAFPCATKYWVYGDNCFWWATTMLRNTDPAVLTDKVMAELGKFNFGVGINKRFADNRSAGALLLHAGDKAMDTLFLGTLDDALVAAANTKLPSPDDKQACIDWFNKLPPSVQLRLNQLLVKSMKLASGDRFDVVPPQAPNYPFAGTTDDASAIRL